MLEELIQRCVLINNDQHRFGSFLVHLYIVLEELIQRCALINNDQHRFGSFSVPPTQCTEELKRT